MFKFHSPVFLLFFCTCGGLWLLSSCYYDKEDELYAEYYTNLNCDTTDISFTADILPIMEAKCSQPGCHDPGGSGPGDFTGYAGVKSKVDNGSFVNRTITLKNMPPNGPLPDCELKKLRIWVEAGALNN